MAREHPRLTPEERERFGVPGLHFTPPFIRDTSGDGVLWTATDTGARANGIQAGELLFNHTRGDGKPGRRRASYTVHTARLALGLHRRKIDAEIEQVTRIGRVLADLRQTLGGWVTLSLDGRNGVSQTLAVVAGELDGVVSPPKQELLHQVAASVSLKMVDPRMGVDMETGEPRRKYNPNAVMARLTAGLDDCEERVSGLLVISNTNVSRQGWLVQLMRPEENARKAFADRLALGEWDRATVNAFRSFDTRVRLKPATQTVNWVHRQVKRHGYDGLPAEVTAAALQWLHLGRLMEPLTYPAHLVAGRTISHLQHLSQEEREQLIRQIDVLLSLYELIHIGYDDMAEHLADASDMAKVLASQVMAGAWPFAHKAAQLYLFFLRHGFLPGEQAKQARGRALWYNHPLPHKA